MTSGKTIALTRGTIFGKAMCLLFFFFPSGIVCLLINTKIKNMVNLTNASQDDTGLRKGILPRKVPCFLTAKPLLILATPHIYYQVFLLHSPVSTLQPKLHLSILEGVV